MSEARPEPANDNLAKADQLSPGWTLNAFLEQNVPPAQWRRVVDYFEQCALDTACRFSLRAVTEWRIMKGQHHEAVADISDTGAWEMFIGTSNMADFGLPDRHARG
jgi:hypothetical protein